MVRLRERVAELESMATTVEPEPEQSDSQSQIALLQQRLASVESKLKVRNRNIFLLQMW